MTYLAKNSFKNKVYTNELLNVGRKLSDKIANDILFARNKDELNGVEKDPQKNDTPFMEKLNVNFSSSSDGGWTPSNPSDIERTTSNVTICDQNTLNRTETTKCSSNQVNLLEINSEFEQLKRRHYGNIAKNNDQFDVKNRNNGGITMISEIEVPHFSMKNVSNANKTFLRSSNYEKDNLLNKQYSHDSSHDGSNGKINTDLAYKLKTKLNNLSCDSRRTENEVYISNPTTDIDRQSKINNDDIDWEDVEILPRPNDFEINNLSSKNCGKNSIILLNRKHGVTKSKASTKLLNNAQNIDTRQVEMNKNTNSNLLKNRTEVKQVESTYEQENIYFDNATQVNSNRNHEQKELTVDKMINFCNENEEFKFKVQKTDKYSKLLTHEISTSSIGTCERTDSPDLIELYDKTKNDQLKRLSQISQKHAVVQMKRRKNARAFSSLVEPHRMAEPRGMVETRGFQYLKETGGFLDSSTEVTLPDDFQLNDNEAEVMCLLALEKEIQSPGLNRTLNVTSNANLKSNPCGGSCNLKPSGRKQTQSDKYSLLSIVNSPSQEEMDFDEKNTVLKLSEDRTYPSPYQHVFRDKTTLLQDINKFIHSGQDEYGFDKESVTSRNRRRHLFASPNSRSSISINHSTPACTLSEVSIISPSVVDNENKLLPSYLSRKSIDSSSFSLEYSKDTPDRRHLRNLNDTEYNRSGRNQSQESDIMRRRNTAAGCIPIDPPLLNPARHIRYSDLLYQNMPTISLDVDLIKKCDVKVDFDKKIDIKNLDFNRTFDDKNLDLGKKMDIKNLGFNKKFNDRNLDFNKKFEANFAQGDCSMKPYDQSKHQRSNAISGSKYCDNRDESCKKFKELHFQHEKIDENPNTGKDGLNSYHTTLATRQNSPNIVLLQKTPNFAPSQNTPNLSTPQNVDKTTYYDLLHQLLNMKADRHYLKSSIPSPCFVRRKEFKRSRNVKNFLRGNGDCDSWTLHHLHQDDEESRNDIDSEISTNGTTLLCLNENMAVNLKDNTGELKVNPDARSSSRHEEDPTLSRYRHRVESLLLEHYKYQETLIDQKYSRVLKKHEDRCRKKRDRKKQKNTTDQKNMDRKKSYFVQQSRDASIKMEPFSSCSKELAVVNYYNYDNNESLVQLNKMLQCNIPLSTNECGSVNVPNVVQPVSNEVLSGVINDMEGKRDGNKEIFSKENDLLNHNQPLSDSLNLESIITINTNTDEIPAPEEKSGNEPFLSDDEIDVIFQRQITQFNLMIKSIKKDSPKKDSPKKFRLKEEEPKDSSDKQSDFKVVFERIKAMQSKSADSNENTNETTDGSNDFKTHYHSKVSRTFQDFYDTPKINKSYGRQSSENIVNVETFQNKVEMRNHLVIDANNKDFKDEFEPNGFVKLYDSLFKTIGQDIHEVCDGIRIKHNANAKFDSGTKKTASDPLNITKEFNFSDEWITNHSIYKSENYSVCEKGLGNNFKSFNNNRAFMARFENTVSINEEQKEVFKTQPKDNTGNFKRATDGNFECSIQRAEEKKVPKEKSKLSRGITKMFVKNKTVKSKQSLTVKVKSTKRKFWKTEKTKSDRKVQNVLN